MRRDWQVGCSLVGLPEVAVERELEYVRTPFVPVWVQAEARYFDDCQRGHARRNGRACPEDDCSHCSCVQPSCSDYHQTGCLLSTQWYEQRFQPG